jgi:hypothetical protein
VNKDGIPIELHWTIETGPFNIDVESLWERAERTSIAGLETFVLAPEDLLLHLCLHAAFHHRFNQGLRPLWDLVEVLEHHGRDIEWDKVVHRAAAWRVRKHAHLALYLAHALLGASVPVFVLTALRPVDFEMNRCLRLLHRCSALPASV